MKIQKVIQYIVGIVMSVIIVMWVNSYSSIIKRKDLSKFASKTKNNIKMNTASII